MRIIFGLICCIAGIFLIINVSFIVGLILLGIGLLLFAGKSKKSSSSNYSSMGDHMANAWDKHQIKEAIRREEQEIANIKARDIFGIGDGFKGRLDRLEIQKHEANIRALKSELRRL